MIRTHSLFLLAIFFIVSPGFVLIREEEQGMQKDDYLAEDAEPPSIDELACIIFDNMQPMNKERIKIDYDESYAAANEILYCIEVFGMNKAEDLPYVLSLFYVESKFDPRAISHTGAKGFGQLVLKYHDHKLTSSGGSWDDISHNIYISFRVMGYRKFEQLPPRQRWLAIYRRYNGSEGAGPIGIHYHKKFKRIIEGL